METDDQEAQDNNNSQLTFLASPQPTIRKRHFLKGSQQRGDSNFDPFGLGTRILSSSGKPTACHYHFNPSSTSETQFIPTKKYNYPISKLKVAENKGPLLQKSIRSHDPSQKDKKLRKRLSAILNKAKKSAKKIGSTQPKSTNPNSKSIDQLIKRSRESVFKKEPSKKSSSK